MPNPTFNQLFANRHFMRLWLSQMLSQFSIQITSFYVLTRIFGLTRSTVAVSLMWIAGSLPSLILGPFVGVIVDSFSKRRIMMLTNTGQAIVVICILFAHYHVFNLYVIVFLYWLLDQLYYPSQQSTAPAVVPKALLQQANGLFLLTQQASILVGFGLGGILLTVLGSTGTIILAAANLLGAVLAAHGLPKDLPKVHLFEKDFSEFWKDLSIGYRYLRDHRLVLLPFLTVVAAQVFITVIATSFPTFTHDVLGQDLNQASFRLILPGTIGAIVATYFLPAISKKFRRKSIIEFGFLAGSFALMVMWGTSFVPHFRSVISAIVSIFLGVAIATITIPAQTMVQERTPVNLRGRIYGQMSFLLILSTTLPLVLSAGIADLLGVATLMGILGLVMLLGLIFIYRSGDSLLLDQKIVAKS